MLAFSCDTGRFRIGYPVIAIQDHSEGLFKTGDAFLLRGMKLGCHCTPLLLDIGLKGLDTTCNHCGVDSFLGTWLGAGKFKPMATKSRHTIESLLDDLA